MSLRQELKSVFVEKNHSLDEVLSNYCESLDDDGQILLLATAKLFGAYCASPTFNKSRQLDILVENDENMKILRVLIREYGQGVEDILDVYDEYFKLKEKQNFWTFFNKKLDLPEDWFVNKDAVKEEIWDEIHERTHDYYVKDGSVVLSDWCRYDYKLDRWKYAPDSFFASVVNSNDADRVSEDEARVIVKKNGGINFDQQEKIINDQHNLV